MKTILKTILLAIIFIGYSSCEDSDLPIDTLYAEVDTSGSVVRILVDADTQLNVTGTEPRSNSRDILIEIQQGDGSMMPEFDEVRIYIALFKNSALDEPMTDFDGNDLGEEYYETIDASQFVNLSGVNGLPEYLVSSLTPDLLATFPTADLTNFTYIRTRFELEMSDGRVWSDYNSGGALSGPYFSASFTSRSVIRVNE